MKNSILFFLTFFFLSTTTSQFAAPKGFRHIIGENGSGEDDIYTNSKYSFETHKLFRDYDYKVFDERVKNYLSNFFGFPFQFTKDSLCWGTGKHGSIFSYVVVGTDGELVELFASENDSGFANYSKWLLLSARQYKKTKRSLIFPIQ